ncbi:MAG TPA: hypothetical protein VFE19_02860 [Jatrophihabitantaceae bacterium]|nr:hypothetical protein [Jatrophihabitantaceae bacterium]
MRSTALVAAALSCWVAAAPALGASSASAHRARVYAIGDSVMIDAKPDLERAISGITVNADVSRQVDSGLRILQRQNQTNTIAQTTVFGLGTNGTLTRAQLRRAIRLTAGHKLVMITTHCPYCDWTSSNNRTVRALCTHARHCWIAAFQARARKHPQWFTDDGVHMQPRTTGTRRYAAIVKQARRSASG